MIHWTWLIPIAIILIAINNRRNRFMTVDNEPETETPKLRYYIGEPITEEMSKEKLIEIIDSLHGLIEFESDCHARSIRMQKLFRKTGI